MLDQKSQSSATANSQLSLLPPALLNMRGHPNPITMAKGKNVVLPCSFSPEQHFSPFVHHYSLAMPCPTWMRCTKLLKDGLPQGSTHYKIFHVQLSDRRNYTHFVQHGSAYDEAAVKFQVTDPFFHDAHSWMIGCFPLYPVYLFICLR
uniref:Immunoglobulin V-set domain-containing protein n=1 Tax=Cyanistes caeruleus TaxID=156563 RepID=A0A8C0VDS0_CYACU